MRYRAEAEALRTNREQWKAYESKANCIVLAGPGSGKTKVLTTKMARLLDETVRFPRGLACVTYNNECARELRRRLEQLGVEESDRVFVGTLHSFCLRHVLTPYGTLAGYELPPSLRVASDAVRERLLGEALARLKIHARVDQVVTEFDRFRRDCLDRTREQGWEPGDGDMTDICVAYEEALKNEQLLDFDGIVRLSLELVERNAWVRNALRARFPVLVVDEYQDLGTALHRLVLSLCFASGVRLFCVGDPDQSIYGFTGAHPELLLNLALSKRSDVEAVRLRLNYRSGTKIVRASKAALGEHRDYEAHSTNEGELHVHRASGGIDGEVRALVKTVLPDVLSRYKPGDVVVLYPTRYEAGRVEEAIKGAGWEYVRLGRDAAYPRTPLTRLAEDLARWCAGGWEAGQPRLSRLVQRWLGIQRLRDPLLQRSQRLALVRFLFTNRIAERPAYEWLSGLEATVLAQDDARTRLMSSGDVESFDALREACRPGERLAHLTVANLAGQAGSPEHINLLTLHSSKGCEFDVVVFIGADEGRVPSHRANTDAAIAEARRLFYVGISRARHELHIIHSTAIAGDQYQQGASRFVREVEKALG